MNRYLSPPPFHTFDPIQKDPLELIPVICASMDGNHEDFQNMVGLIPGLPQMTEGEKPPLDPATILLLSLMDWQADGGAPRPLDSGQSRERLGRFPTEDGNAIEYLLSFTKEGEGNSNLHNLLAKLARGLSEDSLGESIFSQGAGGIELLGWLDEAEVTQLRNEVERGSWKVSSDEPHDGGVQDAFRHLLAFLRAAGRRHCGLLMRRHS